LLSVSILLLNNSSIHKAFPYLLPRLWRKGWQTFPGKGQTANI
jgi:hypothetical protein